MIHMLLQAMNEHPRKDRSLGGQRRRGLLPEVEGVQIGNDASSLRGVSCPVRVGL